MNLRDLVYVVAVARNKNFSRAANECNVSQPALSSQIKKLENELGADIFERRVNEVRLTEFGTRIIVSAKTIIEQSKVIKDVALNYQEIDAKPFKIGMTPTLAPYITKYFREMFAVLYPKMRIILIEDKPVELSQMVEAKKIDIALIANKSHGLIYGNGNHLPMDFTSLWQEPLLLGIRKDHPLAQKVSIKAKDVPADLLIRFSIPFGYDLEKDLPAANPQMLERTGYDANATRFETVCRHVSQSDDCTIINAIAAEQFKQHNWNLAYLEFEDEGNLRDLGIISLPNYPRQQILKGMVDYIRNSPPKGSVSTSLAKPKHAS